MPSSDSEDFESADEGHSNVDKKERKQRLSSSNYSDNTMDTEAEAKKVPAVSNTEPVKPKVEETADGWDDFDIDDNIPNQLAMDKCSIDKTLVDKPVDKSNIDRPRNVSSKSESTRLPEGKGSHNSQDTGWDAFDDWGDEASNDQKESLPKQTQPEPSIKEVTDRLAASTTSGWGWGWGMDSLLSTATAGISNITSQVSQGISTVLESGIGAPDPEELARKMAKESAEAKSDDIKHSSTEEMAENRSGGDAAFQFGSLFSGVTKFVESTGTKVIAGGLDTLETIGKKTMEVLQDGDPGLAKKRAMLGLDPGDKLVLSQVLREAKAKAEEEDRIREEKREAKEVHYENLFDDFEGLVHLEALEMLSRQVSMRIEERLRGADADKRQDIKETLQQVSELCEMPEEDDDEEESSDDLSRPDAFHERLQTATQDLGLKLQFQNIVKQYAEILGWLSTSDTDLSEKTVYKRAVSGLAQATALSVEIYHKAAEMLLVKTRRSTADEADALTQMTVVLTKHISELATLFTEKLNSIATDNKDQVNTYITNIFLEAGNSSTYVQNAFQLALPILQIGAV